MFALSTREQVAIEGDSHMCNESSQLSTFSQQKYICTFTQEQ
jgi:hypothetical protein